VTQFKVASCIVKLPDCPKCEIQAVMGDALTRIEHLGVMQLVNRVLKPAERQRRKPAKWLRHKGSRGASSMLNFRTSPPAGAGEVLCGGDGRGNGMQPSGTAGEFVPQVNIAGTAAKRRPFRGIRRNPEVHLITIHRPGEADSAQ
jgi:hypothetical protein